MQSGLKNCYLCGYSGSEKIFHVFSPTFHRVAFIRPTMGINRTLWKILLTCRAAADFAVSSDLTKDLLLSVFAVPFRKIIIRQGTQMQPVDLSGM